MTENPEVNVENADNVAVNPEPEKTDEPAGDAEQTAGTDESDDSKAEAE
jgi:hypothetical protein